MNRVYKYPIEFRDKVILSLPAGAKILRVGVQNGPLNVWALVDPSEPDVLRHLRIAGTGHDITETAPIYINSFELDGRSFIFHVFEVFP